MIPYVVSRRAHGMHMNGLYAGIPGRWPITSAGCGTERRRKAKGPASRHDGPTDPLGGGDGIMAVSKAEDRASPTEVAAVLIDRRGVVTGLSRAAEDLLERQAADVLGRSVLRLLVDPAPSNPLAGSRTQVRSPCGAVPER